MLAEGTKFNGKTCYTYSFECSFCLVSPFEQKLVARQGELLVSLFTFTRPLQYLPFFPMRGRLRPLLHNDIDSWWSPPTFNPLLRQFEWAPAFPALWAVSKDAWCQCLLKPQLKFIFRDHLRIQAEGVPGTVGSLRHPFCSNHVHHKSWTMSVRLTLHSLIISNRKMNTSLPLPEVNSCFA